MAARVTVLETDRMWLREMTHDDVGPLLGIFGDPEAMAYYPGTKDREEAHVWVDWVRGSYARHGFGLWVAERKPTGEFAGQCGIMLQETDHGTVEHEIGYLFLRRLWNQGLATEAARAVRDHAFGPLGLHRVVSLITPANRPSRRVAEKIGMTLEREVDIPRWGRRVCLYAAHRDQGAAAPPEPGRG